jgi:hypothetical protein
VIAKTKHKVDQFFQKKTAQVDASMPLQPVEEEKQEQSQPTEIQLAESQLPSQQPEEERRYAGHLRVQVVEESKQGGFMAAQVADPVQRREQMAVALRRTKRLEILSKRRYPVKQDQSFAYEPEEQLDPFAGPMISDFDHACNFLAENPEVTEEQYMQLFESARMRHFGRPEDFYQAEFRAAVQQFEQ